MQAILLQRRFESRKRHEIKVIINLEISAELCVNNVEKIR